MPITFNSAGGFLNGTISASGNTIFIQSSGSVGSVNVGNVEYTGSQVIEKDAAGNVRNKKTFNTDGSITQEKFDASGKTAETKIKNPSTGKEFRRSGSATTNQIEFQQNNAGAFITVSGSTPGFNIIKTGETNQFRTIRQTKDLMYAGGTAVFTVGIDDDPICWYINPNLGAGASATSLIQVSQSGDTIIKRNLTVGGTLTAQELHTEFTSASIIYESGSTQFGDTLDDTHDFSGSFNVVGNITASGDISASGDLHLYGNKIYGDSDKNTYVDFGGTNEINLYSANREQINVAFSAVTFNEAGNDVDVRMESDNNNQMFRLDAGRDKVGIGGNPDDNSATLQVTGDFKATSHITASGNISASGTITGNSLKGGTTQNTGSYDFPGAIVGYNIQGLNVTHASYNLTTTMAVPDAGLNVCFVAPKSGIVEIEVQVRVDMGSSVGTSLLVGLSDNATYNAVATYYEQNVIDPDENDDVALTHKWVVPSLTPGTTYKYWFGTKVLSTSGTPKITWGGNTSGRFSDFIMKATALPSNTEIET